jgi:hypothetical protein
VRERVLLSLKLFAAGVGRSNRDNWFDHGDREREREGSYLEV